jgi:uncharacterized protein YjbI with pentapeptide repeats
MRIFAAGLTVVMVCIIGSSEATASGDGGPSKLAEHPSIVQHKRHHRPRLHRADGYTIRPGAHLRHAHLAHANLRDADLARADLSGADLAGANLTGANLSHANLTGVDLARTQLQRAKLSSAKVRGIRGTPRSLPQFWVKRGRLLLGPRVNLNHAALSGVALSGVDLEAASLEEANLAGDSLKGAILNGAQLTGANLMAADLTDAGLANAVLDSANASDATFTGASLVHASVSGTNFTGANLSGSVLADADLSGATLAGSTSSGLVVAPASLPAGWSTIDGYLVGPGADLSGANLAGADLQGRELAHADLAFATLSSANLASSDLSNSDLQDANLSSADLSSANLTGVDLANANLSSANLSGTTASAISGSPSSLPADWELINGGFQQVPSALTSGQSFNAGQWLESPNGQFTVNMQGDGNLVEYQGGTAIWATGTSGAVATVMQTDCNLVIYNASEVGQPSGALYTTGTGGDPTGDCSFSVADDGSLTVATSTGVVRWERYADGTIFTHRITMTSDAPFLSGPSTASSQIGTIPSGDSPGYVCWTTGPPVGGVDVYFYVSWNGAAGYYPSYYDSSVYATDSRISIDYGIPACGSVPTTFTPPSTGATGTAPPATVAAPITVTTAAPVDSSPGSAQISTLPAGTQPGFVCWTTGPTVSDVNVWFQVYWLGAEGYYPSGLDNSTYATDGEITSKYGVPECAGTSSSSTGGGTSSGGGGSSGGGSAPTTGHTGGTVTGQAILNAASQWIGRTSYCWDGGNASGPTHGKGDYGSEAPDCTQPSTSGFDCSGLALYAIYAAGGPDLFSAAHGPNLEDYGTAVPESAMQVGDIISFDHGQHFAIYAGGGYVVQADTAVHWSGGGWGDGVSKVLLRYLTADLTITTIRRFS